jgi:hypothetical protein
MLLLSLACVNGTVVLGIALLFGAEKVKSRQDFRSYIGEKNDACAQYVPQRIIKGTERS